MQERVKILIGYDGSECADAAIDDLRRAGLPGEATAIVLTVIESWTLSPSGFELLEGSDRRRLARSNGGRPILFRKRFFKNGARSASYSPCRARSA